MKKNLLFIANWVRILLVVPVCMVYETVYALWGVLKAPFSGFLRGVARAYDLRFELLYRSSIEKSHTKEKDEARRKIAC